MEEKFMSNKKMMKMKFTAVLFSVFFTFIFTVSACGSTNDKFKDVKYTTSEDGSEAWVEFTAAKDAKIFMVSLITGENSNKAINISNSSGEMHFENGATMKAGSSLLMGRYLFLLDAGTIVKCGFKTEGGFKAEKIGFVVEEGGKPIFYNIAGKKWE